MKKILLLIACAPSLLLAQTNGLSLAETLENVLSGNPSVRESIHRIDAANAVLKQANSAYLPTLTFTGYTGHLDGSLHPDVDLNHRYADSYKESSGGLEANWLLFDGFARKARSLSAKYGVMRSEQLADETRRLLVKSATVAFRQAQLAKENMQISEQDYRFNIELEDDARKRFKAGTLPEADVHNFSIRALQAESNALQAKLKYVSAGTVLAELMGLSEARLPEEMQPQAIAFGSLRTVPAFEDELPYAMAHRPDFQAVHSGQLALAEQVKVSKGERLPQVALSSSIDYADRSGLSQVDDHGNYTSFVGVTAKWDLFTGGRKLNAVKEAEAEMRALEEQKEALRLSIRSALRQQIDTAETAESVFIKQAKIYDLTTQVRDSVNKSYKAGVASITRLNEAQTELVRAKGAHAASFISYQLSLNQLDIETGRILTK